MPPPSCDPPPHELTALALWLLEVPFDPATTSSGELFDDVMETISEHLLALTNALAAQLPPPPRPALTLEADELRHRREHHALRHSIMAGHLPTGTSTLREAEIRCAQAVLDLTHLRRRIPQTFITELGAATSLLATCARTCEAYRRASLRLHRGLVAADAERASLAALAVRAERDLARRLTRAAVVTYAPAGSTGR